MVIFSLGLNVFQKPFPVEELPLVGYLRAFWGRSNK